MANRLYPKGKIAAYQGKYDLLVDPVRAVLVDLTDYTADFATDELLTDIPGAAIVGTAVALGTKALVAGPSGDAIKFTSANVTLTAVTGDQSEYVLIYVEAADGDRLLALYDTAGGTPGLPITPSGVDVIISCPANGWFNY